MNKHSYIFLCYYIGKFASLLLHLFHIPLCTVYLNNNKNYGEDRTSYFIGTTFKYVIFTNFIKYFKHISLICCIIKHLISGSVSHAEVSKPMNITVWLFKYHYVLQLAYLNWTKILFIPTLKNLPLFLIKFGTVRLSAWL